MQITTLKLIPAIKHNFRMDPGFREMSIHTIISNGGSCPTNSREVDSCFVTCSDS